ncbi:MAG: hypothetical protein ACYDAL_14155 [Candidatus Dormibacteraceae bacterium]
MNPTKSPSSRPTPSPEEIVVQAALSLFEGHRIDPKYLEAVDRATRLADARERESLIRYQRRRT